MSSSALERSFADFIEESLGLVRRECPEAHRALSATLEGAVVDLQVGGEPVSICGLPTGPSVKPSAAAPDVRVIASDSAILDLIDGRRTLSESVWLGHIDLVGAAAEVARFHDALVAYVHGTVRSRSHPALLGRYRARVESLEERQARR